MDEFTQEADDSCSGWPSFDDLLSVRALEQLIVETDRKNSCPQGCPQSEEPAIKAHHEFVDAEVEAPMKTFDPSVAERALHDLLADEVASTLCSGGPPSVGSSAVNCLQECSDRDTSASEGSHIQSPQQLSLHELIGDANGHAYHGGHLSSPEAADLPDPDEEMPASQSCIGGNQTSAPEEITSLMVRNLPMALSSTPFMQAMDADGFAGLYDFCYIPGGFERGGNHGFGFVNFVSAAVASEFVARWHGKQIFSNGACAPIYISKAAEQGLEVHKKRWTNARMNRIRNPELRPFIRDADNSELRPFFPDVNQAQYDVPHQRFDDAAHAVGYAFPDEGKSLSKPDSPGVHPESAYEYSGEILNDAVESMSSDAIAYEIDLQVDANAEEAEGITTLMIRNLPYDTTQVSFMDALDYDGFHNLYDFCYVPRDFKSRSSIGFGFVNFVSPTAAKALSSMWHGSRRFSSSTVNLTKSKRPPALNISPAADQGVIALKQKWTTSRMKRIHNPEFRPFIRRE